MVAKRTYSRWVGLGTLSFLMLVGGSAFTQEKKDPEENLGDPKPKARSVIRAGYTRPGSPSDKIGEKGDIIQVANEEDTEGPVIGSTVYFAVFRLNGTEGDALPEELSDLPQAFVEGLSFQSSRSPKFDKQARYLYLYQIVNDRGLTPAKGFIRPVANENKKINSADVSEFALRLLVDPRYITSWGFFKDKGFEAKVPDRNVTKDKGGLVRVSDENDTVLKPVAFSSDPAIVSKIEHKRFLQGAPAYPLGNLLNNFGVNKSNLGLTGTSAFHEIKQKGALTRVANNEVEAAVKGGVEPDYVQITYNSMVDSEPSEDGRTIGNTLFRVDFKQNNHVKLGQHSVLFGFTSDLPPKDEPIRIQGTMVMEKVKGVDKLRPAGAEDEEKKDKKEELESVIFGNVAVDGLQRVAAAVAGQAGSAVATGNAPTPVGGGQAAAAAPMAMVGGGAPAGGGMGVGGLPAPGAGLGAARPAAAGGGGGQPQQGQQGNQQGQQQQQQQQTPNMNFNLTLNNQQSQLQTQLQKQAQLQKQTNNNCNVCNNGHVVPEPSAILLGLLGLPALVYIRRRNAAQTTAAQTTGTQTPGTQATNVVP